ncbi:1671_t:CDS:2, partial [Scutellospora calospora]
MSIVNSEGSSASDSNSDYNLDTLFQTLPVTPTHQNTNMANAQDVLDYLQNNQKENTLLRIEPFTGDGTQDPQTWLNSFEKTAAANNWKETEDYEEYYDEEPVYVSQNSRLHPYPINRKEARQKQSESQKEHTLRSKTQKSVRIEEEEILME